MELVVSCLIPLYLLRLNLIIQGVKTSFLYITKGVMFSLFKSSIFKNKGTLV
jgi:hypothetical protein